MAAAPIFKIFDQDGKYQAACHELEAAAALMGFYGEGATIRYGHSAKGGALWVEGEEKQPAAESFDFVAETCQQRMQAQRGSFGAALAIASRHRG